MPHSIDHNTLRTAAEHLQAIDDAGYGHQLDRELAETIDAYENPIRQRDNQRRWVLSLAINEVDSFAKRLEWVTRAPFSQCRGIALEMLGFDERRRAVLELLDNMAGEIQARQVQEALQRLESRRIA